MSLESKRLELESLSQGCIAVAISTEEGLTNYNLSFYCPNMDLGRVITNHVSEVSAEEKLQEYIDYLEGTGASPHVPFKATARQMRVALFMSGISTTTIETMINSLSEPSKTVTSITWEYSNEFHRTNPVLLGMATALGLSSAQVDDLFRLAVTL